jgi:hypothetical protein
MRRLLKPLAAISGVLAVVAAGSALYAADSQNDPGSMMGSGMMGHHHGLDQGGMMGMMSRMGRMMGHCSAMMGGGHGHRPNDQWRKPPPENKG